MQERSKAQLLAYTTQLELVGRYFGVRNTHRLTSRFVDSKALGAKSMLFVDLRSGHQILEGSPSAWPRVRSNSSFVYKREDDTFAENVLVYVASNTEGSTAATLTAVEPELRDKMERPELAKATLAGVYSLDRGAGVGKKSGTITTTGTIEVPVANLAFDVSSTLLFEAQSSNLRNQVSMRPSTSTMSTTFTGRAGSAYAGQVFKWSGGHEIRPSRYYSAFSRLEDSAKKRLLERSVNVTLEESGTQVQTLHFIHKLPFNLKPELSDCSIRTNYKSNVALAAVLRDWKALLNAKRQISVEAKMTDAQGQKTAEFTYDSELALTKPAADGSGQYRFKRAVTQKASFQLNGAPTGLVITATDLEVAQNSGLLYTYNAYYESMNGPLKSSDNYTGVVRATYRVADDAGPANIRLLPFLNKQVVLDYELSARVLKMTNPMIDVKGNVTLNRRGISQLGTVNINSGRTQYNSKRYLTLEADTRDAEVRAFRVGQEIVNALNPNISITSLFAVSYKYSQVAGLVFGGSGVRNFLNSSYLLVNAVKRVELTQLLTSNTVPDFLPPPPSASNANWSVQAMDASGGLQLVYVNSRQPYSLRGELSFSALLPNKYKLRAVHKYDAVSASSSLLELGVEVKPPSRYAVLPFALMLRKSFNWLDAFDTPQLLGVVFGPKMYQYTSNGTLQLTPLFGQKTYKSAGVFKPKNGELRKTFVDETGTTELKMSATYQPTAANPNRQAFELQLETKTDSTQQLVASVKGTCASIADVDAALELSLPKQPAPNNAMKMSHRHRFAWPEELAYRGSVELLGQTHLLNVQYTEDASRTDFVFEYYCPVTSAQYYKLNLARAKAAPATIVTAKLITASDARATDAQSRLDATLRYDTTARTASLELKDVLAQPLQTTVSAVAGGYNGQVQYGGANVGQVAIRYPLTAGTTTFEVTATANVAGTVGACASPALTTSVKYDKAGDAGRALTLQFDQKCAGASNVKFDGLLSATDAWNTDVKAELALGFSGARAKRLAFEVKRASATKQALDQSISTTFEFEPQTGATAKFGADAVFKFLPRDYRLKVAYSVPAGITTDLPKTLLFDRSYKAIDGGYDASAALKVDSKVDLKWRLKKQEASGTLTLNFDGSLGVGIAGLLGAVENANANVKFNYTQGASNRKLDAAVGVKVRGSDVLTCNDIKYERLVGEWPTMSATIELPYGKHVWTTSTEGGGAVFKAELDVENAPGNVPVYPKNVRLSIRKADWESTLVVAYSASDDGGVVHTINANSNLLALFLKREADGELPTIKTRVVFPQRVLVRYRVKEIESELKITKNNLRATQAPANLQAKLFARRAVLTMKVESESVRNYELTHTTHVYSGALVQLALVDTIAAFRTWIRGMIRQPFYLESSTTVRINNVDHSGSLLASRNEEGEVPAAEWWPIRSVRHQLAIDSNNAQTWLSDFTFKRLPAGDNTPKLLLIDGTLAPSGDVAKLEGRYKLETGKTAAGKVFNVDLLLGIPQAFRASYWRKSLWSEKNTTLALSARVTKSGAAPAQVYYKRSITADGNEYARVRELVLDLAEGVAQRKFQFNSARTYCVRDEHPRTLKWTLQTPFRNASYAHTAVMYQAAEHKNIYAFPVKTFDATFSWKRLYPQEGPEHTIGAKFTQVKDPATFKWTGNLSASSSLMSAPLVVRIEKTGSWLRQVQTTSTVTFGTNGETANVALDWSYYQNRVTSRCHITHAPTDSDVEIRYTRDLYAKRSGLKFGTRVRPAASASLPESDEHTFLYVQYTVIEHSNEHVRCRGNDHLEVREGRGSEPNVLRDAQLPPAFPRPLSKLYTYLYTMRPLVLLHLNFVLTHSNVL